MGWGKFKVAAEFRAIDRITKPIAKMQKSVGAFTRSVGVQINRVNQGLDKFGRAARRMAFYSAIVGAAAVGAFTNIASSGMDFEQAIANVGAVSLKTVEEIAPLKDLARELGRTTIFTATESANAMEILARSGFKMNQVLKATPGVLAAAAAGQMGIAETSDIVTKALKGMGLDQVGDMGEQAVRVADVLALASTRTNSTMGSLGESLSKVASVANDVGFSLEQTVAAVALLQDIGLDPAVAGTALKTMLGKMAKPPQEVQRAMDKMTISFKDANGDILPFENLIQQLAKGMTSIPGSMNRMAFLIDLVGLRGQLAANNLTKLFESGRLGNLTKDLEGAKGVAERMAKLRLDTVRGDLIVLRSAIDSVKISIFEMSKGPLRDAIQEMTEWVRANEELIAQNVGAFIAKIFNNRGKILDFAEKWGKVLVVVLAVVVAFKVLVGVLTLVNLVMNANPIVLIVMAAIALIGVIWALAYKFGILQKVWEAIRVHARLLVKAWSVVKDFFVGLWDALERGARKALGIVVKSLERVKGVVKDIGGFFGWGAGGPDPIAPADGPAPVVITSGDRVVRSIEETRSSSTSEVTIRDETGRAEVTRGTLGNGLRLQTSGGF